MGCLGASREGAPPLSRAEPALLKSLSLASYKLRLHDNHVRAVPVHALDGTPFEGPGVDLRGEDARQAIVAAHPMIAWLDAREPGVRVRSISVLVAPPPTKKTKNESGGPRVLVSLEPSNDEADPRPRALRFDPPHANELRDAARDAERVIGQACVRVLLRRISGQIR